MACRRDIENGKPPKREGNVEGAISLSADRWKVKPFHSVISAKMTDGPRSSVEQRVPFVVRAAMPQQGQRVAYSLRIATEFGSPDDP
jgi:hypothetical protein